MKIRAFLLLVFLLLGSILLFSCGESGIEGEGLEAFEEMLEDMTSDTTETTAVPFAAKVYVIIAERCSGQLAAKAEELATNIKSRTGVDTVVKYDNEDLKLQDADLAIYLGNTNSLVSVEAIKPLRYGDYICKWDHECIFLGGRHDEATVLAVDWFVENVLHGASNTSLMSRDAHFEHINDYEIDKIVLNGYDLYDFTLVYEDDGAAKTAAELIRALTVKRGGYFMNIIPSSELDDTVGKTVSFAVKGDVDRYGVVRDGLDISVYGGNEYALSVAVAEFADTILASDAAGVAVSEIADSAEALCVNRVINVCQAYFELDGVYDIGYSEDMISIVKDGQYDIIVFNELDDTELGAVKINLLNFGYSVKSGGEYYTVLYKTSVFETIDCSTDDTGNMITVIFKVMHEKQERKFVCAVSGGKVNVTDDGACGVAISDGDASAELMMPISCETVDLGEDDILREVLADRCLNVSVPSARTACGNGYIEMFYSVSFNMKLSHRYFELKDSVK